MTLEERVQEVLRRRLSATRRVDVGPGAVRRLPEAIEALGLPNEVLAIAQPRTWEAASAALQTAAEAGGMRVSVHVTFAEAATHEACERLGDEIRRQPSLLPVAVGAGTVNDLVKLGAQDAGVPYVCVATAASMNGYPSSIGAVLRDGLKCTVPATPPVLIIGDTDLLSAAPPELTGSGYADLLAKPCSVADWILAREVAGEGFEEEPLRIMDGVVEAVVAAADGIAALNPASVESLMLGLTLSGLSMAAAGTSQPASGAEHLISHFWDMLGHRDSWRLDLHGRQVGVACIMISALWERLLSLEEHDLTAALGQDADALRYDVIACYGDLAGRCLSQFSRKSPSHSAVAAHVERARGKWADLRDALRAIVVSPARMRDELAAGGAPTTLAEIGRSPDDARLALRWARVLRNRYTCLDLAAEAGHLGGWIDELVAEVC